ncbi:FAD:protein FMN transferase, partial [Kineococcus glutinatus]|uniref:FAD:protein FMN transferase n=1 Tax=Kineococcus glutinatus TaxID=1070872 RepID=UPI0031F1434E
MPLQELLPLGPGTAQWDVWSTLARLVVTSPPELADARAIVEAELARVDAACSRFRDDSELAAVERRAGTGVEVSPLLAELVAQALLAAERTGGDVDPTLADAMCALGYDRDVDRFAVRGVPVRVVARVRHDWRAVRLRGRELTLPPGTRLDLGATAKAVAADRCAAAVHEALGCGVLVSLGGDIATAGPAPGGWWDVLVSDGPQEPASVVALPPGAALATSSTLSRRWRMGTRELHHVLDPRTLAPVAPVWRTASVAAASCAAANTASTAALVRGGV